MVFLQGNVALLLGLIGFLSTLGLYRLAREATFKQNIRGAAVWFGIFLLVRLNGIWLAPLLPTDWHALVRVTWMLAFAFASIRSVVSMLLWVRRKFRAQPSAKIHRDVFDFVLYVLVTIPILKTQLKLDVTTLLGTSAVISLVLGLALQDTLGNLFAGLALQLERPYQVGDFIRVGELVGKVSQIAWRSTRLETVRGEAVTIPNSSIAKERVTNLTSGGKPIGIDIHFGASYSAPPNTVKEEVLRLLSEIPVVLIAPAPSCRVVEMGDSSITYQVRFFVPDFAESPPAHDEILSRLWYRFGRAGIEIPFPQRVVTVRSAPQTEARHGSDVLHDLDVLAPFTPEERSAIAATAVERRFGRGEHVVTEGHAGQTFYVVLSGTLAVRTGQPAREVATLKRGQAFGEISLLTGEPRAATVVALEDCAVLELDRPAFARHFAEHPERAKALADLLATRRAELALASATADAGSGPSAGRIFERLKQIFSVRS